MAEFYYFLGNAHALLPYVKTGLVIILYIADMTSSLVNDYISFKGEEMIPWLRPTIPYTPPSAWLPFPLFQHSEIQIIFNKGVCDPVEYF